MIFVFFFGHIVNATLAMLSVALKMKREKITMPLIAHSTFSSLKLLASCAAALATGNVVANRLFSRILDPLK